MRLGLPAVAGAVLGISLTGKVEKPVGRRDTPHPPAATKEAKLPDDPDIVRIAALAGRSTEARAKIQELLAAGAKDEEIAPWLALVLFSNPGWLDSFILTVPEDRRIALTRLTILKLGDLQADAAWELFRSSPYARQAARSDVEIERRKGLDILGYCMGSPLAAETILDPAFGLTDKEINEHLRWTYGNENAECIMDAWIHGRWKDSPPGFVRDAWSGFRKLHKDDLPEIEKNLPAEIRTSIGEFNSYFEQRKQINSVAVGQLPTSEELAKFSEAGLNAAFNFQRESGTHIPLETLVRLPAQLRKPALEHYFEQYDSFHPEMIRESVEEAGKLDLTPPETRVLLEKAALLIWQDQGDYQTALDWATRIPDAKGRAESVEKILTELAQQDPQSALDYIANLPAGELRDKIEHIATEAQP